MKHEVELSNHIDLKNSGQVTKTHKIRLCNWLIIILIWIVTVGIQAITSFWVTGLLGMILGVILSAIPFFLGIWAIKTIIERDTWYI